MWLDILFIIISVLIAILGYNLLKVFLFDRIHINKWIFLAVGIIFMFIPALLNLPQAGRWAYLYMPFSVIPLLAFFNLMFTSKKEDKKIKRIKIKPKAKPNRVKNNHK